MNYKQKSYEDKLNEQMGKMDVQFALLGATEADLIMAESDIEYYKSIEAYIVAEEN
jgi:hypothetical protein